MKKILYLILVFQLLVVTRTYGQFSVTDITYSNITCNTANATITFNKGCNNCTNTIQLYSSGGSLIETQYISGDQVTFNNIFNNTSYVIGNYTITPLGGVLESESRTFSFQFTLNINPTATWESDCMTDRGKLTINCTDCGNNFYNLIDGNGQFISNGSHNFGNNPSQTFDEIRKPSSITLALEGNPNCSKVINNINVTTKPNAYDNSWASTYEQVCGGKYRVKVSLSHPIPAGLTATCNGVTETINGTNEAITSIVDYTFQHLFDTAPTSPITFSNGRGCSGGTIIPTSQGGTAGLSVTAEWRESCDGENKLFIYPGSSVGNYEITIGTVTRTEPATHGIISFPWASFPPTITVRELSSGCQATITVERVSAPPSPINILDAHWQANCGGSSEGRLEVYFTGEIGSYTLTDGADNFLASVTTTTTSTSSFVLYNVANPFNIKIKKAGLCDANRVVNTIPSTQLSFTANLVTACGGTSKILQISGVTGTYEVLYRISNGVEQSLGVHFFEPNTIETFFQADNYTAIGLRQGNCTSWQSVTPSNSQLPDFEIASAKYIYCNPRGVYPDQDGVLTVQLIGNVLENEEYEIWETGEGLNPTSPILTVKATASKLLQARVPILNPPTDCVEGSDCQKYTFRKQVFNIKVNKKVFPTCQTPPAEVEQKPGGQMNVSIEPTNTCLTTGDEVTLNFSIKADYIQDLGYLDRMFIVEATFVKPTNNDETMPYLVGQNIPMNEIQNINATLVNGFYTFPMKFKFKAPFKLSKIAVTHRSGDEQQPNGVYGSNCYRDPVPFVQYFMPLLPSPVATVSATCTNVFSGEVIFDPLLCQIRPSVWQIIRSANGVETVQEEFNMATILACKKSLTLNIPNGGATFYLRHKLTGCQTPLNINGSGGGLVNQPASNIVKEKLPDCSGYKLTAPAGYASYLWSPTNETTQSIEVTELGTYSVNVGQLSGGGACQANIQGITITELPFVPALTATVTYTGCQMATLLAVDGFDSYEWFDVYGKSIGNQKNIDVQYAGTYTIVGTKDGCQRNTEVVVNFPHLNILVSPNVTCNEYTLTASEGYTNYMWSTGATSQSIVVTQGTYTVTATKNGCTQTATVTINNQTKMVKVGIRTPSITLPNALATSASTFSEQWLQTGGTPYQESNAPSISNLSVSTVYTYSSNFALSYSNPKNEPSQFSIETVVPNKLPNFVPINNATLGGSPLAISIPNSAEGTYNFTITVRNINTGISSTPIPFTITVINNSPLGINSFSPTFAGVDAPITILGTNFMGVTSVTIGGQPARTFCVQNDNTIIATTNNDIVNGNVTVSKNGNTIVKSGFTTSATPNGTISNMNVVNVNGFDVLRVNVIPASYLKQWRQALRYREVGTSVWNNFTFDYNVTSADLAGLIQGKSYEMYLQTVGTDGIWSNRGNIVTSPVVGTGNFCSPTTTLPALVSGNTVTLNWVAQPNASRYLIRYYQMSNTQGTCASQPIGGTTSVLYIEVGSTNTYVIQGLIPNKTYAYDIQVYCNNNLLATNRSNITYFTTGEGLTCKAPVPTFTQSIINNKSAITATWVAPELVQASFQYSLKYQKAGSNNWINRNTDEEQYTMADLESNTDYEFAIAVYCQGGIVIWSPTYKTTTKIITNAQAIPSGFGNGQRGIWKPHETYAYITPRQRAMSSEETFSIPNLKTDGVFDLNMFNWKHYGVLACSEWLRTQHITQYNSSNFEIENKDILDRYTSALYGYKKQLPIATAGNARVDEIAYESFEEYSNSTITPNDVLSNDNNFDLLTSSSATSVQSYRWLAAEIGLPRTSTGKYIVYVKGRIFNTSTVFPLTNVLIKGYSLDPQKPGTFIWRVLIEDAQLFGDYTEVTLTTTDYANAPSFYWKGEISITQATNLAVNITSNITLQNVEKHTGKNALRIERTTNNQLFNITPRRMHFIPHKKYIISAWVKLAGNDKLITRKKEYIDKVYFTGDAVSNSQKNTYGDVIEGWVRIEQEFTATSEQSVITLTNMNNDFNILYIDDIRIQPFNSSLQTYVYDPQNYKLRATLDGNNFASLYYYDEQGNLQLTKKETERGIQTIQEAISHQPKQK